MRAPTIQKIKALWLLDQGVLNIYFRGHWISLHLLRSQVQHPAAKILPKILRIPERHKSLYKRYKPLRLIQWKVGKTHKWMIKISSAANRSIWRIFKIHNNLHHPFHHLMYNQKITNQALRLAIIWGSNRAQAVYKNAASYQMRQRSLAPDRLPSGSRESTISWMELTMLNGTHLHLIINSRPFHRD